MKTEAKDPREYGFEGEMAMSQLKGIMQHAESLHGMLKPDTDLPEWVQSKITLAYDYIQTAADYMSSEMNEEVNQKYHAGMDSFSSREAAMKHAKKKEDQGYLTHYSSNPSSMYSSASHTITHYFRDKDHYNEYRRQKYAEKKNKINEEVNIDTYADSLIKRDKQNLRKDHVVHAARIAGVDHKKLLAAVQQKVGRLKEEAPTNAAGGGSIDGIGVGARGEPGVRKTKYQKKNAAEAPKSPVMDGMVRRKMPSFKQFMG